jgi:geranylgeranyl reductase
VEHVEHLVIGAGPAGLRAAQVLAEAGREVLVLERNAEVGPKTCGGGLTAKAVRDLQALGLPGDTGLSLIAHGSFKDEGAHPLEAANGMVRTVARRTLGALQARWTRAAGAEIRVESPASEIDLTGRTVSVHGSRIRFTHLIGADGSTSAVRRALGIASPRDYFAAEFNIPGVRMDQLTVSFDSAHLASGYFWIFPHSTYVCVGAGAPKALVPPATIRPYLQRRLQELGIDPGETPYEGATIEVSLVGLHFPGNVHLVGDAAGCPSGLTAEGIYPALVTGEEVARQILEPNAPAPKTAAWLRSKRQHDLLGRAWLRRGLRDASFSVLAGAWRSSLAQRLIARFFLGS